MIFTTSFEESSLDALNDNWEEVKNISQMEYANIVPPGANGDQSILINHMGGGESGIHLYRRLLPGYDKLYFRYYVRIDEDCWPIHHFCRVGGYNPSTPWPQGGAGLKPDGDERFSVATEPFGTALRWDYYSYWMEMHSDPNGDHWGNDFINQETLTAVKGEWVCLEVMVQMNYPVSERNGELALWIDGEQVFADGQLVSHLGEGFPNGGWIWDSWHPDPDGEPFQGFRWRMDEELKINFLWMLVYITTADDGHLSKIWFDNVVVAEEYVGPIVAE